MGRLAAWRRRRSMRRYSRRRGRSMECEMEEPKHIDVVRRAYLLWQQAGEPQDRDEEFYLKAKEELQNESELSPEPDIL